MRPFNFDDAERRLIRKWYFAVMACYGTVLAAMVAIVFLSQTTGNWMAAAAQTQMHNARPAAEASRPIMEKN